jgi:hypothetical protein
MVSRDDLIMQLKMHANLPVAGVEKSRWETSLGYQFWRADEHGAQPRLELIEDVVACICALNPIFNGPDPNTRRPGPRTEEIPDILEYSIACIINLSLWYYRKWSANKQFADGVLASLLIGIARVAHCWENFLAGDISDLLGGFDFE